MEISFIIPVYNGEKFIPVSYTHLSEIQEVYLLDDDYVNNKTQKRVSLTGEEYDAFENLMFESNPDWNVIDVYKRQPVYRGDKCTQRRGI